MNPADLVDGTLVLKQKKEVARNTIEFLFEVQNTTQILPPHNPQEFSFQAGQFINLLFTPTQSRAYSIASAPHHKHITLLVRIIPNGLGSTHLQNMSLQDTIPFKGAFGHFTLKKNSQPIVFLATGTGIAPFKSMQNTLQKENMKNPITLFYGGKDLEDIAYLEEIKTWPHSTFHLGLSQSNKFGEYTNNSHNSRITHIIQDHTFAPETLFYLCGNGNMIEEATNILIEKGHPKTHILSERFF